MTPTTREKREAAIETAAYALLAERGYAGTSMLLIAKSAKASNETLYRWYGDKPGLFKRLIERNADTVKTQLEAARDGAADPLETLRALGPALLTLLTSERAIAINRAAATDQTGALGAALAEAGRGVIAPLIAEVLIAARTEGHLAFDDPHTITGRYIDLLVGDLQIRRAIGTLPLPDIATISARADQALNDLLQLHGP